VIFHQFLDSVSSSPLCPLCAELHVHSASYV
jgi:hypothetical protein